MPFDPPPPPHEAQALCETFRHSGWAVRRRQTLQALQDVGTSQGTIERFQECGARAWIMRSVGDKPAYRLALNRCRNRWCQPCATERRVTLQINVTDACADKELRFVTLTLKSNDEPLASQVARLRKSFRRLRTRTDTKHLFKGGVYFLEISFNADRQQWHPHLHVICEGRYLPVQTLRDVWHDITGDSFICDIRAIKNARYAAGYIAKYAGKPCSPSISANRERFAEIVEALQGSKTFHPFGCWRDLQLSKSPAAEGAWEPFMPLAKAIVEARAGDDHLARILRTLKGSQTDEPLDLDDSTRSPPLLPDLCD